MTTKKTTTQKSPARKLKLKKETIKDLSARKCGEAVKGGAAGYLSYKTECMISCYQQCMTRGVDCDTNRGCKTLGPIR